MLFAIHYEIGYSGGSNDKTDIEVLIVVVCFTQLSNVLFSPLLLGSNYY